MKKHFVLFVLLALLVSLVPACKAAGPKEIVIGINAPMTGDIPKVGEGTKYAAEIAMTEVNDAGGLEVGGKKYPVRIIVEDNEATAEGATAVATKLITQDNVLIMIGAQASKQAIPAGQVANDNETPMISPWSTNPRTTKDRPWVFRACFLDPFQGPVDAKFAMEELGAQKAAVLYDVASDYPKGLAEEFKKAFEALGGQVVAFETFTTKDKDFSAQLTKIKAAEPDVLFVPQYYDEVPLIAKQAHELGITVPILGSDSWGSAELMNLCGDDCKGSYFSTHYAAAGATGATKAFIDTYNAEYGYVPDDVGALTYDAMYIAFKAIQDCGELTGDLKADRQCVRDALAQLKNFEGITGRMDFSGGTGDPLKCAVIVRINDAGEFEFYKSACPEGM
jgi:branched-chain amino acid transport system substrate-binding protein